RSRKSTGAAGGGAIVASAVRPSASPPKGDMRGAGRGTCGRGDVVAGAVGRQCLAPRQRVVTSQKPLDSMIDYCYICPDQDGPCPMQLELRPCTWGGRRPGAG